MIDAFRGKWSRLGNYSPCLIFFDGHAYMTVEHAYQTHKSIEPKIQQLIRNQPTPNAAKRLARKVDLRTDWEEFKVPLMRTLLREKFASEPERSILLSTGDHELVEGNWWNDRFWGQCPVGNGENWLGRLLMEIRSELRSSP